MLMRHFPFRAGLRSRHDVSPLLGRGMMLPTAVLGSLLAGVVDVATGAEIHVVSLYFLPLVFAGWQLSRTGAAGVALFTTVVWMAALYENGAHHDKPHIWVINFITQGCAFLAVTLLVSRLSRQLIDEQLLRRTDLLTRLLSRSGFVERAEMVLALCRRHRQSVCLAYIDLDRFKQANDRFGHEFGDELLRHCGAIIQRCVRATDVAGRIGGDEFVLLLPESNRTQALEVCQRIMENVGSRAEFQASGVTVSIGVVLDEDSQLTMGDLMRLADAEMYRVKQGGRNDVGAEAPCAST